mmetsp:Transcript_46790/g.146703  ORF Transcript_46790/g.146703 Transcript_46790/m.146703 type:complete len:379 (-) Transcript_46790:146-1282(-)
MHLIRLARGGQPPPSPAVGLPHELMSFLAGLQESPAELAREGGSRSASRNRAEAPPPPAAEPLSLELPAPESAPAPFDAAPGGFESGTQPGDLMQPELDFPGTGKKEKKKKHRKSDHGPEAFGGSSPSRLAPDVPAWLEASAEPRHPASGHGSGGVNGVCATPDMELAQRSSPPTRMGLPVPDLASRSDDYGALGGSPGARDPHYTARVREILGLPGEDSPSKDDAAAAPVEPTCCPPAEREGALHPLRTHPGDHDSRVMWTVLMGAKPTLDASGSTARSKAAEAAVLPPSSAPFLRTIAPNYRLGETPRAALRVPQTAPAGGSAGLGREHPAGSPVPGTAPSLQHRLFHTSMPVAQVLREQLSALPTSYTSQISMSV